MTSSVRVEVIYFNFCVMKKFLLFVVALLMLQVGAFAQTNFEELTLDKALDKAKAEGKLVFVDMYTSWCMPCKYMANTIFPKSEMGEYLNPRFVCVKFNTEEGEGAEIMKRYEISAFPTFLILNTKLGHRACNQIALFLMPDRNLSR